MTSIPAESSLDRFLINRAPALLRLSDARVAGRVNLIIGAAMIAVSGGLTAVAAITRNFEILAGVAGPMAAGVLNLSLGGALIRKGTDVQTTDVTLSPEAKTFLTGLFRDVVGWTGLRQHRRRRLLRRMRDLPDVTRRQASSEVVDASVFGHLDRAAAEANRVYGILEQLPNTDAATLALIARVRHAADESMAAVLHSAAFVDRYPEACAAPLQTIEEQTQLLRQLADRLPALAPTTLAGIPPLLTTPAVPHRIQSVLDELDLRNLAQNELMAAESKVAEIPPVLRQDA